MLKAKNQLDEMQEQKLLRIEHNGCWLSFWALLIVMAVELFIGLDWKAMFGEWIVFMLLSLYIGIDCIRNGIWDRHLKATAKTNLFVSLIGAFVLALLFFFISLKNYGKPYGALATAVFVFIFAFLGCFVCLSLSASVYKKRLGKMENEQGEE